MTDSGAAQLTSSYTNFLLWPVPWAFPSLLANSRHRRDCPGLSNKEICPAGALDQFAVGRGIAQLVLRSAVELTPEGYKLLEEIVVIGQPMEASYPREFIGRRA